MPGIYGSVGCPTDGFRALDAAYRRAWGNDACDVRTSDPASLGGHAFDPSEAVVDIAGDIVAVDGEPHIYQAVRRWRAAAGEPIASLENGFLHLHPEFRGNAAVLNLASGNLHLGVEWSGAFPLYYSRWEGGLLFASLLQPLARVTDAEIDPLGLLQYLRRGYVFNDRTPFRHIHRLRPGEVLRFDPAGRKLERRDQSQLWLDDPMRANDDLVHACWDHLTRSLEMTLGATDHPTIMLSGGWDSRTLLAGTNLLDGSAGTPVSGFSHGDVESRELNLVRQLCRTSGIPCHLEPIDNRVLDLESLKRGFARTGTVNFPHWHRSGRVLAELGVDCGVAGVFGEILGGHYGRTMAAHGGNKVIAFLREWFSKDDPEATLDSETSAWNVLRIPQTADLTHWYLNEEFDRSISAKRERINAEIRSALARLHDRGIGRVGRLIEACISEHRGSQYIAAQAVSLRAAVDVSHPFGDRELLRLATRIPPGEKLHNTVNWKMLNSIQSPLSDYPMAATLVPAGAPVVLQEMSRGIRKLWETSAWKAYFKTDGSLGPPSLSWVNFEFLRDGEALHGLVDSLKADIWDVEAMRARIHDLSSVRKNSHPHPLYDQFAQILTVDFLLRGRSPL